MTIRQVTLAVVAGAAVGAALSLTTMHGLQAQPKPPVYAVIDVARITDANAYAALGPRGAASLPPFGGKFLARTDRVEPSDGYPPQRYVLIAFDNLDKAKAWRDSAAMKEIWAIQEKSSHSRIFFVEGTTP